MSAGGPYILGEGAEEEAPYTGPPPMRPPTAWQPVWLPPAPVFAPVLPPPLPPGMRWAPPPGTPPHDVPQPYLLAMRSRDWAWWRPLLGLLLFAVVYFVLAAAAGIAALLGLLASGTDPGVLPDLVTIDLTDPWVLLFVNVSLIVAIPCVWMLWAVLHGMGIGWSSSVLGRLRWRLLPAYTGLAFAVLGAGIGLSVLLGFLLGEEDVTGPVPGLGWLLVVVLLTTPLQSAAEEYVFRGYLSQAVAGWIGRPEVGALVAAVTTAALFSALHAPPDVPTFLDRFAFGLAASAVVWLTGGLEAAIVLHAVNNVLVFVLAGLLGEGVATTEVPLSLGLVALVVSLLTMAAYVAVVARTRRRLAPETSTGALDLRTRPPWGLATPAPSVG
jgi:membrane protease YdiL (CAAX protease family)